MGYNAGNDEIGENITHETGSSGKVRRPWTAPD